MVSLLVPKSSLSKCINPRSLPLKLMTSPVGSLTHLSISLEDPSGQVNIINISAFGSIFLSVGTGGAISKNAITKRNTKPIKVLNNKSVNPSPDRYLLRFPVVIF